MSDNDSEMPGKIVGCLLIVWRSFVLTPMWLVLMFGILSRLEGVPAWMWGLYWVYIPAVLVGVLAAGIYQAVSNDAS